MNGHYTGLRWQTYPSTNILLQFVGDSPTFIFFFNYYNIIYGVLYGRRGMWGGGGGVLYVLELSSLEMIQAGDKTLRSEVHKIINCIWYKDELRQHWNESIIVSIYKNNDRAYCFNYRGVSLLSTSYKIVSNIAGFEVLTAVALKNTIFWDIRPCSPLSVNRRFGGTYRLHLQGRRKLSSAWKQVVILFSQT
jgi:hypothetical protein